MARRADRYALYQKSVQSPEHEVAFFRRVYKATYGHLPTLLREDFCGAGAVACEWVRSHP